MEALQVSLLLDYYGELLTERQRTCLDLRYNQDLSLSEIAEELNVSRQGVFDNISRAEALLENMEAKTGCIRRDRACKDALAAIEEAARKLMGSDDSATRKLAQVILDQAGKAKE